MVIAGVITPSPIRRDTPIKVRKVIKAICLVDFSLLTSISFKTIVPPSPFLPRLMASHAYSIETSMVRVQKISDSTPIIFFSVGCMIRKIAVRVYIGLVPMSPNTIPRDFITLLISFIYFRYLLIRYRRNRSSEFVVTEAILGVSYKYCLFRDQLNTHKYK
ncbi:MAG: hypothetical protein BWY64_03645 [bacterium ADurb.Bin363]|nr:MAG: hypothetical protein BWY64_03645 [bacterium ADurb.Bin363]